MIDRAQLSDAERAKRVRRIIRGFGRRTMARHPILKHQDALGMILTVGAALAMLGNAWLYATGVLPAWATVIVAALAASILHEIEHDLIHHLYFKNHPLPHNFMMFVVWVFRGNVGHGWERRKMHLNHHRTTGTLQDIETRIIGLGQRWGLRRLLMLDPSMCVVLNTNTIARDAPTLNRRELMLAAFPLVPIFSACLLSFFAFHIFGLLGAAPPALLAKAYPVLDVLAYAWLFPNMLRVACLHVISGNVHYYEDVENVTQELQMLSHPLLAPFNLFCFNFGKTHLFHHFVVDQPFYLRQLMASRVTPALIRYGIRSNDLATFVRGNRFRKEAPLSPPSAAT